MNQPEARPNDPEHDPQPQLDKVVVCHPEPLVAAAMAAILRARGAARSVTATPTLTRLLARVDASVQVAVVSELVDEDIAELFEAFRYRGLATPVVIVSEHPSPERTARAIELGAAGLVSADCAVDVLCRTVVSAGNGGMSFGLGQRREIMQALQSRRLQRYRAQRCLAELSGSERRVLLALADGTTVTVIAARMSVSPRTVRGHIHRLGTRLGASGQLRIAAAGRELLASAGSDTTVVDATPDCLLSVAGLGDGAVIVVADDPGVTRTRPLVAGGALVGSVTDFSAK